MIDEGNVKSEELVTQAAGREEIHSKAVRAGKRTYFFDVKATRRNDYYLTITESKKRFNRDGKFFYEKHKLFLYKEDFDKFADSLKEIIEFIREANPQPIEPEETVEVAKADPEIEKSAGAEETVEAEKDFTNVEFEDLGEESA
ncbi:MAG: PUR family DNA/RNA-binding protein [Bacteroidales bacterium]|nr:PUR family DNA/RNA-binding protein [Bacteroidales bacterium]